MPTCLSPLLLVPWVHPLLGHPVIPLSAHPILPLQSVPLCLQLSISCVFLSLSLSPSLCLYLCLSVSLLLCLGSLPLCISLVFASNLTISVSLTPSYFLLTLFTPATSFLLLPPPLVPLFLPILLSSLTPSLLLYLHIQLQAIVDKITNVSS